MSMTTFDWKPAWDAFPDDHIDFPGLEYYELPDGTTLYEGDKFWDTENRHIVTVSDVKQKVYRGVVGYEGEEGSVYVFYDRDWSEPRNPRTPSHYTDDINYMSEREFARRIGDGQYVPHRDNGAPLPPP